MKLKMKISRKKAFTLVEILIAISIISILAVVSIISLNNSRASSRDAKRMADVRQMQTALRMFYNDYKRYPTTAEWGTKLATGTNVYLEKIPPAPAVADGECGASSTSYIYESDGKTYTLKFCTGSKVGDFVAGFKKATPDGIKKIECNDFGNNDLITWLKFDNDFVDYSKTSMIGTGYNVSFSENRASEANSSFLSDGNNGYIDFGDNSALDFGTSDYTISVWIKSPWVYLGPWSGVIGKGLTTSAPLFTWAILTQSTATNIVRFDAVNDVTGFYVSMSSGVLNDGWNNIVVTRNGLTNKLYVNGVLKATKVTTSVINFNNSYSFQVANRPNGTNTRFNNPIDDVCIYSKSFSESEVLEFYNTLK